MSLLSRLEELEARRRLARHGEPVLACSSVRARAKWWQAGGEEGPACRETSVLLVPAVPHPSPAVTHRPGTQAAKLWLCPLRQKSWARPWELSWSSRWTLVHRQDRRGRAPPGVTFTNLFRTCQVAQEKASSYHFLSGRMGFLFCFQRGWDWAGEGHPLPTE